MRHIVRECPMFAQRENKRGHDWVDRKIHWEVFRKIDFDVNKNGINRATESSGK